MNDSANLEQSTRMFFDWVLGGLRLPDMQPVLECANEAEIPATVRSEVTDAIDDLCKVLVRLQYYNRIAIEKQLKRARVVNLFEWKKNRIAIGA